MRNRAFMITGIAVAAVFMMLISITSVFGVTRPAKSDLKDVYPATKSESRTKVKGVYAPAKSASPRKLKDFYAPTKSELRTKVKGVYAPAKSK